MDTHEPLIDTHEPLASFSSSRVASGQKKSLLNLNGGLEDGDRDAAPVKRKSLFFSLKPVVRASRGKRLKEGWLLRHGTSLKNKYKYRKRYVILWATGELTYYPSQPYNERSKVASSYIHHPPSSPRPGATPLLSSLP